MKSLSVVDETKGEVLPNSGQVSFSYGVNSPIPDDGQIPVPSANFSVGGDGWDNLLMLGHNATIYQDSVPRFAGTFAQTSDNTISHMSVAHATNALNQEIRTYPITQVPGVSDSQTPNLILSNTIRHWFSECGLTEFGVGGDLLFSVTNTVGGVAYYNHPYKRFKGSPSEFTGNISAVRWNPNWKDIADPGAPFTIGDSVTFAVKVNPEFGLESEGREPAKNASWQFRVDLNAGKSITTSASESYTAQTTIGISYEYGNKRLLINERDNAGNIANIISVYDTVEGYSEPPYMITLKLTRISATDLDAIIYFYHDNGVLQYSYTTTTGLIGESISVKTVLMSAESPTTNPSNVLSREGIQGFYIVTGNSFTYDRAHAWPLSIPNLDKPKFYNLVSPGLSGNAWSLISQLCTTYGMTYNPILNKFTLNENLDFANPNISGLGSDTVVAASVRDLSKTITVQNYSYENGGKSYRYIKLWDADQVFSVEKGQRLVETITLPDTVSFWSVGQPEMFPPSTTIDYLNRDTVDARGNASVYSVFDDDNLELTQKMWEDSGGALWLEPGDNPNELKLNIQAPVSDLVSKETAFHISVAGSDIPGLTIAGIGVVGSKKPLRIRTGASREGGASTKGIDYDSPLVGNEKIAWDIGNALTLRHGSIETKLSGTFPTPETRDFEVKPILKRGSFYLPTSVSETASSRSFSEAVRMTPVGVFQAQFNNIECGDLDFYFSDISCREVNISPLGKVSF